MGYSHIRLAYENPKKVVEVLRYSSERGGILHAWRGTYE